MLGIPADLTSATRHGSSLNPVFRRLVALVLAFGVAVPASAMAGILLQWSVSEAEFFRTFHPWILWGLPWAGLGMVGWKRWLGEKISLAAPLFIGGSTVLTLLCGGSVGCEGAVIRLGKSVGKVILDSLALREEEGQGILFCCMSAAFAPMLGTPLTAAFLVLEKSSFSRFRYLGPCLASSFLAWWMAVGLGMVSWRHEWYEIPTLSVILIPWLLVSGVLWSLAGLFFREVLNVFSRWVSTSRWGDRGVIFVGGWLMILATLGMSTTDYLGVGRSLLEQAWLGKVAWEAFLVKMLLTILCLGVGFQGGKIIPAFCIGATLGSTLAGWWGLPGEMCVALGIVTVFCGVTQAPLASLFLSLELFGAEIFPWAIWMVLLCRGMELGKSVSWSFRRG